MYRAMQDSTRLSCCRLARPRAHARLSGEANGDDLVLMRYFVVPKKWEEPDQISDMRWKISEISLFRKNGVETPRYLLLKCFFGLHSPDMSLLS